MALEGRKYLFVHVPRTGGASLREQLSGKEHIHSHCLYSQVATIHKTSFGFCRHPVEWLRSMFVYVRTHEHYDKEYTHSFDEYVEHYCAMMKSEQFTPGSDYYCTQSDYLRGIEYVLHYERIMEYGELLRNITGTRVIMSLRRNASDAIKPVVDIHTMGLIQRKFEKDFINFNYNFI